MQVRGELGSERLAARVREICPEVPDLRDRSAASIAFAPSLLAGYALRLMLPLLVALETRNVQSTLVALVVGRIAFTCADVILLRRVDRAYAHWWTSRAIAPRRSAQVLVERGRQWSTRFMRWSLVALSLGVASGLLGLLASVIGAPDVLTIWLGFVALCFGVLTMVLGCALLCATAFETLAPTFLGPDDASAYVVSRSDVAALRPLLNTRPLGFARDAWELLRTLRP